MSRETEYKRRSPSVIAKLMGLDGVPSQQAAYKQQKCTSENHLSRIRSTEKGQRSDMHSHRHSSQPSSKEKQEFKDVFEVLETSKVGSCSCSLQGAATSKCNDPEMAFIRQKFVYAKRLSSDEKLQNSKAFQDTVEVLDSNKHLLIKFLKQPDSMFTKHMRDLQSDNPRPRCRQVGVVKSPETHKPDNLHHSCKSASEISCRNSSMSPKHRDCYCSKCGSHADSNFHNSPKNQLEGKNEAAIPTRIVILKPNLGKWLSASKTISSPCSSHSSQSNCRKHKGILSTKNKETELCEKKNFGHEVGLAGHKGRESREHAKEITWQMRNDFPVGSVNFCSSAFKGYAGDESSFSMSDDVSDIESEVMLETPRDSFDLYIQPRPSLPHCSGSSMNREAKKRLSERWRMTHKSQDFGAANWGSTLAEMLAIPDNDMRQSHLKNINDEAGLRNKVATHGRLAGLMEPFGISSRDGWNNRFMRTLTRSRSLSASSVVSESPKGIMCHEPLYDDRYLIPQENSRRERKTVKCNSDRKSVNRQMISRDKKLCSSSATVKKFNDTSPRTHTNQNHVIANLKENHLSDQPKSDLKAFSVNLKDKCTGSEDIVDMECKNTSMPFEPADKLLPEVLSQSLVTEHCQFGVEYASNPHAQEKSIGPVDCSGPFNHSEHGLASPVSSKETEQPSPVSVLEVPFIDDVSSCSDCFDSLSTDLQGLRTQLQVLKMGSDSYTDGPILVSSDEDVGDRSTPCTNAIRLCNADNWESSYVVDVVIDSGLADANADVFMASWHSPECPVNQSVFEELEKRYYNHASWPRSERRLLFDRINSAVIEIFHQSTNPQRRAMCKTTMVYPRWFKGPLQDDLQQLLASEENRWKKDTDAMQKVFGKEPQWFDLGEDVDNISKEIERMLLDELVGEVVALLIENSPFTILGLGS